MSNSDSFDEIESLYTKYEKEIFTHLIWAHLFDEEIKYEDKDIFEKTEKYLKDFFVSQKIEWNDTNRERIHSLVLKSDNAKLISDYFQNNYELCLESKLNWTSVSSVKRMVNQLIDESIENKTKLSYDYAKRLLTKYYYEKYIVAPDKDKIITNVMTIFFTYNDIQRLIDEVQLSLDALIRKAYYRLNELLGVKIDPKFFIRKFVMLKCFHFGLYKNPQLLDQLTNCQYVQVYKDLIDKINIGVNDVFSKNRPDNNSQEKSNSQVEKKTEIAAANDVQPKLLKKKEEVVADASRSTKEKKNNNIQSEASPEEAVDLFLKKIGNKNQELRDPITELLASSADIIKDSEEHSIICETIGPVYFGGESEDLEIKNLLY